MLAGYWSYLPAELLEAGVAAAAWAAFAYFFAYFC